MKLLDRYSLAAVELEIFEMIQRIRINDIEDDETSEILDRIKTLSA